MLFGSVGIRRFVDVLSAKYHHVTSYILIESEYIVPMNLGGLVIPTPTVMYDGYPANVFAVQELYKLGLGVSYKSHGVDIFRV
jgi:hypothetical protein